MLVYHPPSPFHTIIHSHSIFQLQLHTITSQFSLLFVVDFSKKKRQIYHHVYSGWEGESGAAYEADLIIGAIHLRSFLRNDDDVDDNDEMRRTRMKMRKSE